jgi:hypothetical protein
MLGSRAWCSVFVAQAFLRSWIRFDVIAGAILGLKLFLVIAVLFCYMNLLVLELLRHDGIC